MKQNNQKMMFTKKQLDRTARSIPSTRSFHQQDTKIKLMKDQNKRAAYRIRAVKKENKTLKNKLEIMEKTMNTTKLIMEEKVNLLELLVEEQNIWVG